MDTGLNECIKQEVEESVSSIHNDDWYDFEKLVDLVKDEMEEEINKWESQHPPFTGFCTIFLKKKNKPMLTFDTLEWFTEGHWKAIALMKWAMWTLRPEIFQVFKEYVNGTGELNNDAEYLVKEFDKRFRILVGKN